MTRASLAAVVALGLVAATPAHAASLREDADYVKRAAPAGKAVSPQRVARGYVALQAYAIANDRAFRRAVELQAKGKTRKEVLAAVQAGPEAWLRGASDGSLSFLAMTEMARSAVRDAYRARAIEALAAHAKASSKDDRLAAAEKRIEGERADAARQRFVAGAAGALAVALVLGGENAATSAEGRALIEDAVDALAGCLQRAATKRDACLEAGAKPLEAALCEASFAADSLVCLAP